MAFKLWSGMVPVIGTVAVVGPVELADHDTTYRQIVIRDQAGALREFTMVRAVPELSGLVQPEASGTFLFWSGPTECRLAFVYRDDGARAVDFDAVREYFEQV
jgi:hypothetical protein